MNTLMKYSANITAGAAAVCAGVAGYNVLVGNLDVAGVFGGLFLIELGVFLGMKSSHDEYQRALRKTR